MGLLYQGKNLQETSADGLRIARSASYNDKSYTGSPGEGITVDREEVWIVTSTFSPPESGSWNNIQPLNLTGSIYGQLVGTASYATQALSASYAPGGGGTPGGSDTQIQYNNASSFGGVPVLTYDGTTLRATGSFTGSFEGLINGGTF